MGKRGPAREPDAAKLARGITAPSRLSGREPLPRARLPVMPAGMSDRAKTVWKRELREMGKAGVISAADTDLLRAYCETVVRYRDAQRAYEQSGALIVRPGGILVKNPLHQVVRDDIDTIRLLARELGLSPSGRAGFEVEAGPIGDDVLDDIGLPPRLRMVPDVA